MRRTAVLVAAWAALALLGWCRPGPAPGAGPDSAIVVVATWTAWLAAVYLAAGMGLAATTAGHDHRAARLVPLPVRLVVRQAVGAGAAVAVIGGGLTGIAPAWADSHHARPTVSADWPLAPRHSRSVVVHAGDCLWTLAAGSLRRPTPARIAETWPQWWRANRAVIGTDPDLIHPGQRLRPPTSRRAT